MSPGKSLELTIVGEELENISKDLSETVIDSILDEGVLKEIPIISSVVSGFKIYSTIRERFYIKKLYKFLYEIHNVSQEDRENFIGKFSKDEDKTDFFEKLLFLIDRQDDVYKSTIVGKLFCKTLLERISTDNFLRCAVLIDRIYIKDLQYFKIEAWKNLTPEKPYQDFHSSYDEMINDNLEYAGLLISEIETKASQLPQHFGGFSLSRQKYKLSPIGKILLENGFS